MTATLAEILAGWTAETASDIHEHLPKLRSLASCCDVVVEFGVFRGASSTALLNGCKGYVYSYDVQRLPEVDVLLEAAGGRWIFRQASSIDTVIPECQMLFIDSWHTGEHLTKELDLHHHKVARWIAMHDTETFGTRGEDGQPGLWPALMGFLAKHSEWRLVEHFTNCNGLSILERA